MTFHTHHRGRKAETIQLQPTSRFQQRYSLRVSCDEDFQIVQRNSHHEPPDNGLRPLFIGKQSNRVSVWRVPYDGEEMVTLYNREHKRISTYLPPRCMQPGSIFWLHLDDSPDAKAERWENAHPGQA